MNKNYKFKKKIDEHIKIIIVHHTANKKLMELVDYFLKDKNLIIIFWYISIPNIFLNNLPESFLLF